MVDGAVQNVLCLAVLSGQCNKEQTGSEQFSDDEYNADGVYDDIEQYSVEEITLPSNFPPVANTLQYTYT